VRTDALAAALPIAGIAIRLFVASSSPLPPDNLAIFLLTGALQDTAAGLLIACLSRAFRWTGLPDRIVSILAALPFLALVAGHAGWAEAIVYFGHPPRREDVEVALGTEFVSRSADALGVLRLVGFVLLGAGAATVLGRLVERRPGPRGLRLLATAFLASALALAVHRTHPIPTANGVLLAVFDLAHEPRPEDAQGRSTVPPPRQTTTAIRDFAPARAPGEWLSDEYPLAARPRPRSLSAPRLSGTDRPNVVFLLMEGVRAREISCYGGPAPGLTPNLDRLAREGLRFERAYSPGTSTPQGEVAYWYGLLATPGSLLPVQNPDAELNGLPEILRENGWRSFLWIHNGDESFYRRDRFYLPRGFRMIDGRDFPRQDPRTNWGRTDKALARRAVEALDQTPEPFAALVLTVSNHHPFQLPEDATSRAPVEGPEERGFLKPTSLLPLVGRHTVPMMKTIHYTDEAVGDFFRLAAARNWSKRTVFVVSGDHGLPIVPVGGLASAHELAELRHHVPLILWSPMLEGGGVIDSLASLADVPPTILGLLGLDSSGFIGEDLLDPRGQLQTRPLPLWDDEAGRVTILKGDFAYHATVAPPRTSADWRLTEESLFETREDPRGTHDLSRTQPDRTEELRRLATTYLDVYPWIVLTGRGGGLPGPPAGASR
jgi:arylsulfatase A-like enzyme